MIGPKRNQPSIESLFLDFPPDRVFKSLFARLERIIREMAKNLDELFALTGGQTKNVFGNAVIQNVAIHAGI